MTLPSFQRGMIIPLKLPSNFPIRAQKGIPLDSPKDIRGFPRGVPMSKIGIPLKDERGNSPHQIGR